MSAFERALSGKWIAEGLVQANQQLDAFETAKAQVALEMRGEACAGASLDGRTASQLIQELANDGEDLLFNYR